MKFRAWLPIAVLLTGTLTNAVGEQVPLLAPPANTHAGLAALIYGKSEITVKSRAQGEITAVKVTEGQRVKRGDLIAQLDDRQERIDREVAEAELKLAKTDWDKSSKLKKYVSGDEINQKQSSYLKKKSTFELKLLDIEKKKIASPIDGIVTRLYFERGETTAAGDKFVEIVQMDDLYLIANVSSVEATRFKQGDVVPFKVEGIKDTFKATVMFTSPVIDASSDTVRVKLEAKNIRQGNSKDKEDFVLKPGMVAVIVTKEKVGD
jgi:membrane fusion protein (multidrug efflux system)